RPGLIESPGRIARRRSLMESPIAPPSGPGTLPTGGGELVRPPGAVAMGQGLEVVELLARWGGGLPRDAGAAEPLGREAHGTRDGLHREIPEAVGAQLAGHRLLRLFRDDAGLVDERCSEQLALARHVDAVIARGDDRRAGDAEVDLPR